MSRACRRSARLSSGRRDPRIIDFVLSPCESTSGNRSVTKRDMVHNAYLPTMQIDPQTYEVRADGVLLTCEPAKVLPMAQRYFLF